MRVLITGSNGFIGKNLIRLLEKTESVEEIMEYGRENSYEELEAFCTRADAVYHLAAGLRPKNLSGFDENIDLTSRVMQLLELAGNKCPIMFASSIQADLDNPYGQCKRIEEDKFIEYGQRNQVNTYIFRFPNLFGIMSRPNYTSVVSTFCFNTIKGLPIVVNDPAAKIKFAFIENALENVINIVLNNIPNGANRITTFKDFYLVGIGELAYYMETLKSQSTPSIHRDDDFYDKLSITYEWYRNNYSMFET